MKNNHAMDVSPLATTRSDRRPDGAIMVSAGFNTITSVLLVGLKKLLRVTKMEEGTMMGSLCKD